MTMIDLETYAIINGFRVMGLPNSGSGIPAAAAAKAISDVAYRASSKAGWHTDLATGKALVRNQPEMFMLMVTEVSEADEGRKRNLMDDKLPQYPMEAVELADVCIRIGDWGGMTNANMGVIMEAHYDSSAGIFGLTVHGDVRLMQVVNAISAAMEGFRKSKTIEVHEDYDPMPVAAFELTKALVICARISNDKGYDLGQIIIDKMAFNANRPDHKIANRKKEGGKKC